MGSHVQARSIDLARQGWRGAAARQRQRLARPAQRLHEEAPRDVVLLHEVLEVVFILQQTTELSSAVASEHEFFVATCFREFSKLDPVAECSSSVLCQARL